MPDKTTIKPICDMLIDQNKFIGKDPIGYRCSNEATANLNGEYFMCNSCINLLGGTPEDFARLTLPPGGTVYMWKNNQKIIDDFVKRILDFK